MTFSICVGSYAMPSFLELNLRALRDVFGNVPILVYDGRSKDSAQIKDLADRFEASYITENVNRTHFMGCLQTAVSSLAFARAMNCDIALKINQRMVLLAENIPNLIEEVFDDPSVLLATPPAIRVETIKDDASKFHARFPRMVDILAFRAAAIDPQWIAEKYAEQVRTGTGRHDALTEHFWQRMTETEFKDSHRNLPFLSEPSVPPKYLRKCQAASEDYQQAAVRLGMNLADFPTVEWSAMLGAAYRPLAAFG